MPGIRQAAVTLSAPGPPSASRSGAAGVAAPALIPAFVNDGPIGDGEDLDAFERSLTEAMTARCQSQLDDQHAELTRVIKACQASLSTVKYEKMDLEAQLRPWVQELQSENRQLAIDLDRAGRHVKGLEEDVKIMQSRLDQAHAQLQQQARTIKDLHTDAAKKDAVIASLQFDIDTERDSVELAEGVFQWRKEAQRCLDAKRYELVELLGFGIVADPEELDPTWERQDLYLVGKLVFAGFLPTRDADGVLRWRKSALGSHTLTTATDVWHKQKLKNDAWAAAVQTHDEPALWEAVRQSMSVHLAFRVALPPAYGDLDAPSRTMCTLILQFLVLADTADLDEQIQGICDGLAPLFLRISDSVMLMPWQFALLEAMTMNVHQLNMGCMLFHAMRGRKCIDWSNALKYFNKRKTLEANVVRGMLYLTNLLTDYTDGKSYSDGLNTTAVHSWVSFVRPSM